MIKAQFPQRTADIATDEFLAMFKRVLTRAGKDGQIPCTILILDEAQQYIGDSETRSVLLTEIAEALCKQMDSKVMLVAAGQSALTGVRLLNKLLDRFTIRIHLSDTDVETVTQVLLRKQPAALASIAELFNTHARKYPANSRTPKSAHAMKTKRSLLKTCPLLPVRRRF